jgi:uncharacterized protein (TIGR00369 family)
MTESELPDGILDRFEDELEEHGLFAWLNFEFLAIEPGRVVFEVPFDEKFANLSSGAAHGGVTATAMDTASAFALRSTFDDPFSAQVMTTDLDVRYVDAARDDLRVEAIVIHAGGTMGYTDCEATTVREGEPKTVATGGTSYRLFRE